ncbi:MAG: DUF2249 domain-containing protein [Jatrophihabitans sp.]|nr:MAG: DUF2249 domain-containing protein [Jatrophihabitans sp.]
MASPHAANAGAIAAIRDHHEQLAARLRALTAAVLTAGAGEQWQAPLDALREWYRTELIPHAVAEEARLYAPAAGGERTALLVRAMLDEHRTLVALIAELALSRDALHACTTAASAEAIFASHLGKENDLLLPALDQAGIDLPAVLQGMHEILGGHGRGATDDSCGCGCGSDGGPAEPIQIGRRPPEGFVPGMPATGGAAAAADGADLPGGDLDVRVLPHGQRHEIIFARLDALAPGEELVIVNDHDPKPLRYQTAALWPDVFEWTYRESGPQRWRVAITRAG